MSQNKNLFNSIELRRPNRNWFDLTHDHKTTTVMGRLTPIMVVDCVPGDHIKLSGQCMVRMAPMLAPIMHRIDATIHYFFVPNRLVWEDWERFITGANLAGPDAGPTPALPTLLIEPGSQNQLTNYMGVPPITGLNTLEVDAMPFAAYQMIWNEYYRDQNLIQEVDYNLVPGDNTVNAALRATRYRAWEHDYFTSALPFAQKGASVDIPLGGITLDPDWSSTGTPYWAQPSMGVAQEGTINQLTDPVTLIASSADTTTPLAYDPAGTLVNEATSINDLRRAFRLQEWLEKNARAGTRYTESILAHFGVRSDDARLQRPEYIVGVKTPIVISEVLNTTGTETDPQGAMAGHGISVADGRFGEFYCKEHGYVIGIMSVLPRTAYQQGLPRMYSRKDRFEYYWPEFANIGEQAILNREIYADVSTVAQEGVFGYTPRYSEYKYMPSRVSGDFQTTLAFWHLGQIYDSPPLLNQNFVEARPSTRIFAVEDGTDYLWCHILNRLKMSRLMPKHGTPMF